MMKLGFARGAVGGEVGGAGVESWPNSERIGKTQIIRVKRNFSLKKQRITLKRVKGVTKTGKKFPTLVILQRNLYLFTK